MPRRNRGKSDRPGSAIAERGWTSFIARVAGGDTLVILGFLAFLLAFSQSWSYNRLLSCIDYYQFWVGGQAAREIDTGDLYSDAERQRLGEVYWKRAQEIARQSPGRSKRYEAAQARQTLETYSTPWLYAAFGLASSGDYDRDQERYLQFSLVVHAVAIVTLCALLGYPSAAGLIAVAVFSLGFRPVLSDMHVGNVNRVELGLIALFLWIQIRGGQAWRQAVAGFVLGVAVMFKPNLAFAPLILALGWIGLRRYRDLVRQWAGLLAGVLFAYAAASWYFRSARPWVGWVVKLPELMGEFDLPSTQGNHSLSWLIQDLVGFTVVPVFSLLSGGLVFWMARKAAREGVDDAYWDSLLAAMGCVVSLLCSKLAWLHYFVLAIPAVLIILRPIPSAYPGAALQRGLAILCAATIALDPFLLVFGLQEVDPEAAWITSVGTVILFALLLADARTRPRLAMAH